MLCTDDTNLIVYDTINAKKVKTLCNKVHGISNAHFTHINEAIVCTTTIAPCMYAFYNINRQEF